MPAYKDEKKKTWYCKFNYRTWQGDIAQKKKTGFKTKKEALEWERSFKDNQAPSANMQLSLLAEKYLEDLSIDNKRSTSVNRTSMINNRILSYFPNKSVSEIDFQAIRSWLGELKKTYSDASIKQALRELSSIYNYANRIGLSCNNPCRGVKFKGSTPKIDPWSFKEYLRFIDVVTDEEYKLFFNLLYYTGMRVGEALALEFRDINEESGQIRINKSLFRLHKEDLITLPKTEKGIRTLDINTSMLADLQTYMSKFYDSEPQQRLFQKVKNTYGEAFKRYVKKAGVRDVKMHGLRHAHASFLLAHGKSYKYVQERLGHEDASTTINTYGHLFPDKDQGTMKLLEKCYKKNKTY